MENQFNQPNNDKEQNPLLKENIEAVNNYLDSVLEETFDLKARKKYMISNAEDFLSKKEEVNDRVENLGVIDSESEEKLDNASLDYIETDKIVHEDAVPENELDIQGVVAQLKELDTTGEIEENLNNIYRGAGARSWEELVVHLNTVLKDEPDYWDSYKRKAQAYFE